MTEEILQEVLEAATSEFSKWPQWKQREALGEPSETCDKCGKTYTIGEWPFCPHEPDVKYSWHFGKR